MTTIMEDNRPISALIFIDDSCFKVNEKGVTKIEAYTECGEMAPIVWFKVYFDNKMMQRVNSKYIATIQYKEGDTP